MEHPGGREDPDDVPRRAADGDAPRKRRRGSLIGLFFLALLAVLIVVVPRHGNRSRTFPPGRWGNTIACLEHDATYKVLDPAGALPDAHTLAVMVQDRVRHTDLAQLRNAGSAARATAIAAHQGLGRDTTAYRTDGPIVWAFDIGGDPPHQFANAGDHSLVDFCARTPQRRSG
jgi:hypothetical protein